MIRPFLEVHGMTSDLRARVDELKAVSHPLRLRVLSLLAAGELCVCQVAEVLQVPVSSVSEALRELKRVGFVTERREGRWVHVSVPAAPQPLLEGLLADVDTFPTLRADRQRAIQVRALPVPDLCRKTRPGLAEEDFHA